MRGLEAVLSLLAFRGQKAGGIRFTRSSVDEIVSGGIRLDAMRRLGTGMVDAVLKVTPRFESHRVQHAHLPDILNVRQRSLVRGNVLVWGSLVVAVLISGFPHTRASALQIFPTLMALAGTVETVRCIRKRWSFYHAGVLLCIYMDLMAVSVILFLLIYPYVYFLASSS